MVSFTPRPLYFWGKYDQQTLDRRLGGIPEPISTL
jgi:hypothetical protein